MSENLDKLRKQINDIDAEIIERLNARAKISCEIGKAKEGSGQEFYSPSREESLLKYWESLNKGPLPNDALKVIFREILSVSYTLQKELLIAYLGPGQRRFSHCLAGSGARCHAGADKNGPRRIAVPGAERDHANLRDSRSG